MKVLRLQAADPGQILALVKSNGRDEVMRAVSEITVPAKREMVETLIVIIDSGEGLEELDNED